MSVSDSHPRGGHEGARRSAASRARRERAVRQPFGTHAIQQPSGLISPFQTPIAVGIFATKTLDDGSLALCGTGASNYCDFQPS